jgi:hypothetical protein
VGVVAGVDVGVVAGVDVGVVAGVDAWVLVGVDTGVLACVLAGVDAGVVAGLDAWVLAGADAGLLACVDEPWNDDALDEEEDALREADWEADALGAPRPPAADGADEEVSPAGEGVGVDGFPPVKEITA